MEMSQLKKSIQDIAKTVGVLVEEKFGERAQLEEQVRTMVRQVEKVVTEALWSRGTEKVTIGIKRLPHFKGELPSYATAGAAGMDVRACIEDRQVLQPGERALIPTGLSVEIPRGYEIQVRPRSGLAISKGISLVNTPGTVDSDYRGEVKVIMINLGQEPVTILAQERIAQLVVAPVIKAEIEEIQEMTETERGEGGFGSTGKS